MAVKIVVPPTVTPVEVLGLDAIKQHLRVASDITDEDDLITAYMQAAWDYAERITWRQFLTADLQMILPCWPCPILIPKPPTVSVLSVEYYDENNALQTWDSSNYRVDSYADVAELLPVWGVALPVIYPRHDAIRINFRAGYGTTAGSLPAVLLHAVKLLVAQYYETREPEVSGATTADHLLSVIACRDERLIEFL